MATFLLEVGTEELPADFVATALQQWQQRLPQELAAAHLAPQKIHYYGTPRRLALVIEGLLAQQPDTVEEVKGPPASAAYKDGQPTKAALGFAQKQGVQVADFEVRPTDKGDFIYVRKQILGRPTVEIFQELIPSWITELQGKRFMRWADGDLRFPRPIRWLVALLDDQVLPLVMDNASQPCRSDRLSQGHRVLHPQPVPLAHADQYCQALEQAFVLVDPEARRVKIRQQVVAAAEGLKGEADIPEGLLAEVTNLVEWPTAVVGSFDAEFLELPPEVTISEMQSHQRYFPVLKGKKLLPNFITVSNGDPQQSERIATGNGRVIRARLSDGKFFFDADRAQKLEAYLPKLDKVTFQADLGSVRQKVERIGQICEAIAAQLNLKDLSAIARAALLCKADLVTQMVGEFPELQGIMGEKYARHSGESAAVATAIVEHYLPKGAGDALPQSEAGRVVGLADRFDTLVCIFGLGQLPTGSSDPFALRRAANAIVNICWDANWSLNLETLLTRVSQDFAAQFPQVIKPKLEDLQQQLRDFFLQRLRTLLQDEQGMDYDLVNAVLGDAESSARALANPCDLRDRAQFLQALRSSGGLAKIYETVNRASRLAAQGTLDTQQLDASAVVQPALFQKDSERNFYAALAPQTQPQSLQDLVQFLETLAPIVATFFDGDDSVMVMDSDPAIQQNRLNLLGVLRNHTRVLADFGAVVKS
jgi:glycyl-tRNA synthetase beta chain